MSPITADLDQLLALAFVRDIHEASWTAMRTDVERIGFTFRLHAGNDTFCGYVCEGKQPVIRNRGNIATARDIHNAVCALTMSPVEELVSAVVPDAVRDGWDVRVSNYQGTCEMKLTMINASGAVDSHIAIIAAHTGGATHCAVNGIPCDVSAAAELVRGRVSGPGQVAVTV